MSKFPKNCDKTQEADSLLAQGWDPWERIPSCLRAGTPREQIPFWLREGTPRKQNPSWLLAQGGDPREWWIPSQLFVQGGDPQGVDPLLAQGGDLLPGLSWGGIPGSGSSLGIGRGPQGVDPLLAQGGDPDGANALLALGGNPREQNPSWFLAQGGDPREWWILSQLLTQGGPQ